MKRVLALDISSHAGYAFVQEDGASGTILEKGIVTQDRPVFDFGPYPQSYYKAAAAQAEALAALCSVKRPDVIVVEETNLGKNRYSQKLLEFIHAFFLFRCTLDADLIGTPIVYLSSSAWRSALGMQMSKEDKKANAALSKAKKQAKAAGQKLDKKTLGIKGKVSKKHLAIRYVNETWGLALKVKDNDIADAICLAAAYLRGAPQCDGS